MLGRRVRTAFVDVLGPTPADVLRTLPDDGPTVLVPAFLSSGYHVRTDIPAHVAASGHPNTVVTAALGPAQQTVRVVVDRLLESGWRPSDSVVLAAAGTSDPGAQRDLRVTAALLSAAVGQRVELAYAATGEPSVASAVASAPRPWRTPCRRCVVPVGGRALSRPAAGVGRRRGGRTARHPSRCRPPHRVPVPQGACCRSPPELGPYGSRPRYLSPP